MKKKEDRRVRRTVESLRQALFSLIQERGFESLSVQEIIDRADVGRATFYAHFDNKQHLLVSGIEDLRAQLRERQREAHSRPGAIDDRALAFSRDMFEHTHGHRKLFQAVARDPSGATVRQHIHDILVELVRADVEATLRRPAAGSVATEPLVQFVAGAFFGVLMWWMQGRTRLSIDEVDALFRRLALPALKAASHRPSI